MQKPDQPKKSFVNNLGVDPLLVTHLEVIKKEVEEAFTSLLPKLPSERKVIQNAQAN